MNFDAIKFTQDLKAADRKAYESTEKVSDGGSANLDRAFIRIPRIREGKVLNAIYNAGLYCSGRSEWIGRGYMVRPNTKGMGDKNTVAVKVFVQELQDRGYDVLTFHKMD